MSQAPLNPLNYAQPPQQYGAREGFLLRFCAALIDGAFCFIPCFILMFVLTTVMLFNWLTAFCVIGYVISCCLTLRSERQALHDTMAHTAVTRTQTAAALAMPATEQQPQKQAA